tara:strand:- start:3146 stop:3823 length:678 start_codon:yes stop_codon:yes gene_type:complete
MNWEDEGFVIAKRKFRENAIILDIFTSKFGKVSGIVYGGNSRKIRNYLQLMNKIFIIHNTKNENKIGYFKTELIKPISPEYFDNKNKILCLNSLSSILKSTLPENQPHNKIYKSLCFLLDNFSKQNWMNLYLFWEVELIQYLGFGFNLDKIDPSQNLNEGTININVDNISYKIPKFLVSKNEVEINNRDIYNGLNFSRNLLENKFFTPNNIRFPYSRRLLEKKFI